MFEHKTTIGEYRYSRDDEGWIVPDPDTPSGEGWRMEGSAMSDGLIAWFWVREIAEEKKT